MDAASERTWMPCFYLPGQRVSGNGFQFMSLTVNRTAVKRYKSRFYLRFLRSFAD